MEIEVNEEQNSLHAPTSQCDYVRRRREKDNQRGETTAAYHSPFFCSVSRTIRWGDRQVYRSLFTLCNLPPTSIPQFIHP